MKITVLGHDLSSNASMRAHRLAKALEPSFTVSLIGPVRKERFWPALPREPWMHGVPKTRFPKFADSFLELVELADGDVLIASQPHLASFGAALVAGERRAVPVVLDMVDLETALAPRSTWDANPSLADPTRPGSALYASLLSRATGAAAEITVVSTALQRRFGGTLVPHATDAQLFDPATVDREEARAAFGFDRPTVVFPGTPRGYKGMSVLAEAMAQVPDAQLAITMRDGTVLGGREWEGVALRQIPMLPYSQLPSLLAAADVVAVPQLESEAARHQVPMKVFDAMAMAKPIVATSVSDLPSVLEGCGRLVPPGDADALAAAIAELVADPEEAQALGRRARERCLERYTLEQVGARLSEVVQRVARGDIGAAKAAR